MDIDQKTKVSGSGGKKKLWIIITLILVLSFCCCVSSAILIGSGGETSQETEREDTKEDLSTEKTGEDTLQEENEGTVLDYSIVSVEDQIKGGKYKYLYVTVLFSAEEADYTEVKMKATLDEIFEDQKTDEDPDGMDIFAYDREEEIGIGLPLAHLSWWPKGHSFDPSNEENITNKSTYELTYEIRNYQDVLDEREVEEVAVNVGTYEYDESYVTQYVQACITTPLYPQNQLSGITLEDGLLTVSIVYESDYDNAKYDAVLILEWINDSDYIGVDRVRFSSNLLTVTSSRASYANYKAQYNNEGVDRALELMSE